jgi:outer membrane receptor protein involved in Fe transport
LCTQTVLVQSTSAETTDIQHITAYAYANFAPSETLTLTAGLSGDFFDDSSTVSLGNKDQWNPKLGLLWRPTQATTVRAAAFRTFKRRLITDQTLEPTQVAGFNQFYDEINATKAWRYGIGIDQKFTRSVFGGIEFSKRDIDLPVTFGTTIVEEQIDEYSARAYAYWTPHPWLALRGEYLYEKLERSGGRPGQPSGPLEVKTHKLPLSLSVFHPSGLGGGITATYIDQEGRFLQGAGSDKFWVVDLALKYRLPKRYGFLSAGVRNAGDKQFNFFDTDSKNPQYIPERMGFVQFTLALP